MKEIAKGKQIVLYAAPFLPLVFFKVWASLAERSTESFLFVLPLLLVYCAALISLAATWDKPTYFDWAITGYFLFALLFFTVGPKTAQAFFSHFGATGVYAVLLMAAAVPLLLGKEPFTMHYARKYAPEAVWKNPVFVEINRIMTWVWSALFLCCTLLSIYPSLWTRAVVPMALLLGFGIPFNLRYPDRYLKKIGLPPLSEQRRVATEAEKTSSSLSVSEETVISQGEHRAEPLCEIPDKGATEMRGLVAASGGMKVLALNSSPRSGAQSKTQLLLGYLMKGMGEAGADVTVVNLREKTIKNCLGCFACWTKSPGTCVIKDDMTNELYPLWLRSDLVVYASPLYHFGLNAAMRAFIERTLPVLEPFFVEKDGATVHPHRHAPPKAVVLSVAGLPEKAVFDQLSSWVNFLFGKSSSLVAEIYRPCAESLTVPFAKAKAREVLEALERAGKEIVTQLAVSPETLSRVTQPLTDDDAGFLRTVGNLMWKSCIARGITPREFEAKGGIPRPDSVESFLKITELGFRPDKAQALTATIQFTFTGSVTESCYFTFERGSLTAAKGRAPRADLTIDTPFEVWMDILTKEADGQQMFIEQRFAARGNIGLLMKMGELFGSAS